MRPVFKSEDFNNIYKQIMKQGYMSKGAGDMWEPNYRTEDIAKEINEIINKLIDESPVVYLDKEDNGWHASEITNNGKTHKAYLMFIEEIVKEPCKHEPVDSVLEYHGPSGRTKAFLYQCKHCGVELVAEWKAK